MNKEYFDLIFSNEPDQPNEYQKRIANFIAEYSDVKAGHQYTERSVIREIVGLLVIQGIFTPIELQKQALRDFDVMIPLPFICECAGG